jgi:hypothetical protein
MNELLGTAKTFLIGFTFGPLLIGAAALVAANILLMALFIVYAKRKDTALGQRIRAVLTKVDKVVDDMENPVKRITIVQQVRDVFGWWKRIYIPTAIILWVIRIQVAIIREMQEKTECENLHDENAPGGGTGQ